MSKFMELALVVGKIPEVTFTDVDQYMENENYYFSTTMDYNASSEIILTKKELLNWQDAA